MADRNLTEGPVWKALTVVSGPMMFGILAVLSVGLADAYFLGQLGSAPLAAVGFVYPVTAAITSLAIGLSAGANAVISQALGRDEDRVKLQRMALHATALGIALAVVGAIIFAATAEGLFSVMGAGENALTEAMKYAPIWAMSFPFLVGFMVLNAVFRAHGDGAASAAIMILSAIFAIGLNPVLIFGWGPIGEMGTAGAALATLIGRVVGVGAAAIYAVRRGYLSLCANPFTDLGASVRDIVTVGAPAAFSNAINPAGMALVTAAVATLGEAAVAGFGAATRVQSVALVPLLALSAGIGPVVGQNWGADMQDRARGAVAAAWIICLGYGLAAGAALAIWAEPMATFFASEGSEAVGFATDYLRVVGWSLFGYGMLVTANAAMNARSKPLYSMGLSLGRITAIYVPGAWLGVSLFGYAGILGAAVAANVLVVAAGLWCLGRTGLAPVDRNLQVAPA
ncbi:MATE family efflux transporter [uncultured Tateyamaria sp.]|uniref:MATE family efflux transporter n=1 Tax=uncultured Tateyamaria sp. TaxID=455651 RepID=UPI00261F566D|nr:MATE family efflux transporter [uncultured Tateyamaria sp.]